jgi:hypothetical protein
MTSLCTFPGEIVRAIVIEQLNLDQWHATVQGEEVPGGSLESAGTGVGSFASTASRAVDVADLTGLPVMVARYNDVPKPLGHFEPSRAFWHQRFRGRSDLDHILYGSYGESAA